MSNFEFIEKIPPKVLVFLSALVVYMMFWFGIIFFFFHEIVSLQWYYVAPIVFIPSSILLLVEFGVMEIIMKTLVIVENENDVKEIVEERHKDINYFLTIAIQPVIYLLIFGVIAYYSKINFEKFLWLCFAVRILIIGVVYTHVFVNKKKYESTRID